MVFIIDCHLLFSIRDEFRVFFPNHVDSICYRVFFVALQYSWKENLFLFLTLPFFIIGLIIF